jgi:DNA-binding NarL/FixJ family response regulator
MTSRRGDISISVLIANPQAMARELLMAALNRHAKFHVVHCATTAQEVLDVVKSSVVNVALISATLADGPHSGLGALRQIRDCSPQVRSVILLNTHERKLVVDSFRAGAKGIFSLSQSGFKSLCRCVEQVHSGHIWANCQELTDVMEAFSNLAPMRVVNADGLRLLTRREDDVVRLLAEGMQNREIANELKLSEHTIRNYLFHIFDKLGVSSRIELALYAVSCTKGKPASCVQDDQLEGKSAGSAELADELFLLADPGSGAESPLRRKSSLRGRLQLT